MKTVRATALYKHDTDTHHNSPPSGVKTFNYFLLKITGQLFLQVSLRPRSHLALKCVLGDPMTSGQHRQTAVTWHYHASQMSFK